jgi:acetylglutamate kinase
MMETIEMVLCGQVNRTIVRSLSRLGARAVGLSGLDARTLLCHQMHPKLGRVGDIDRVNLALIESVLSLRSESGFSAIPVIAPVGLGHDGLSYNINADWAASRIASAMKLAKMIFVTDQDGILGSDGKLISECDAMELQSLIGDSVVTGGMLAKVRTILHGLESGVGSIHVINGQRPHALLEELFTDRGVGTVCRRRLLDAPQETKGSEQVRP